MGMPPMGGMPPIGGMPGMGMPGMGMPSMMMQTGYMPQMPMRMPGYGFA